MWGAQCVLRGSAGLPPPRRRRCEAVPRRAAPAAHGAALGAACGARASAPHRPPAPAAGVRAAPPPADSASSIRRHLAAALAAACLAAQLSLAAPSPAEVAPAAPDPDTFENVPARLSAKGERSATRLSSVVAGPKQREIEGCTRKCVPTCIRGGEGASGLGPISLRKELVVFKDGFRSRGYCLSECAQVCALSLDKDKAALLLPNEEAAQ